MMSVWSCGHGSKVAVAACVVLLALSALAVGGCGSESAEPTESAPDVVATTVREVAPAATDALDTAVPTEVAPTEEPTDEIPTDTAVPEATETAALPTDVPPTSVPDKFLSLSPGEDRDCDEFESQAEAQAYWDFHRSAEWPNPGRLDGNGNGVVCEATDRSRSGPAIVLPTDPAPSRPCDTSLTCTDFSNWSEMNEWWNACGRPDKYDKNGDGVPCESLPGSP